MKKLSMILISLAVLAAMTGCQSGGNAAEENVPETTAPFMVVEKETVPDAVVTANTVTVKFDGEEKSQEAKVNDKGEKYVLLSFENSKSAAPKAEVSIGDYFLTAAMKNGTTAEFYENGTIAIYGDECEYTISIASKDGNNIPGTNWKSVEFHGKNGNEVSLNLIKDTLYFRGNDIQGVLVNVDAGDPQKLTIDFSEVEYKREPPKSVMLKAESGLVYAYIQEENSGDYTTLLTSFIPETKPVEETAEPETDEDGNPVEIEAPQGETDEEGNPVEAEPSEETESEEASEEGEASDEAES